MQPVPFAEEDMPRVAFISGGLLLGGSTTFLCNLCGDMTRRRHPHLVLSLSRQHEMAADFSARNISVVVQDDDRCVFEDRMAAALQELRKYQPNVVVAALCPSSFEVLRYSPPGVLRLGMVQSDDEGVYAVIRRYARYLDGMVGVSRRIADKLAALPELQGKPVHYIPYGVSMPPEPFRTEDAPDRPPRILYLGRLSQEQKRVRLFPLILKELQNRAIPFVWTIAGDGDERSYLEQAMATTDPRQVVRFTGAIPYAQVPAVLEKQDVFLLTSDYEGLPLSLLEAMGHGVVPVVSDLPSGIREVVDSTNGILVPVQDIAAYAQGIVWLDQHRAELAQMSRLARARVVEKFSVEAMTDRWLEVLNRAPAGPIEWPRNFRLRPPLEAAHPWRFREPVRTLRRWGKRLGVK